ncbi:MAG TPA: hypothetical protein VG204_03245, partial [Terriglobia bacterium]|nr:hypothetical protein [Terriglobia bacterium]
TIRMVGAPATKKFFYISAIFPYFATIRINKFLTLAAAWDRRSSRHDECFESIALRRQMLAVPDIPRDHFRLADDSFRTQN